MGTRQDSCRIKIVSADTNCYWPKHSGITNRDMLKLVPFNNLCLCKFFLIKAVVQRTENKRASTITSPGMLFRYLFPLPSIGIGFFVSWFGRFRNWAENLQIKRSKSKSWNSSIKDGISFEMNPHLNAVRRDDQISPVFSSRNAIQWDQEKEIERQKK